ncbi:hypothetical protein OG352_19345 [Streptomyces sp. NBC_01485]|uniref:hypothetical protein n=1 Tax=Streptomyces sp. NBC_01485 TaxID=2903884 RepID=UPI002E2FCE0F|nr:hypothetical protein [Streptomyces sp. NBC_01485]
MASPGYGKRSAPGELPRANHDFAHLPPREAAVAAYIDRLPGGTDISVKTLAKTLPYGQCALRTALNNLQRTGHLRRGRERVETESGSSHWVTRTWFTRTARDDDWWATFIRGDLPESERSAEPPRPTRSRAHILLAALGRTAPALSLSAADCTRLAPLVEEWFARGATEETLLTALTAGLPTPIHSPAALLQRRLADKIPPEPPAPRPPAPHTPGPRPPGRMLECAKCGIPGRTEALPGGFCGACRGEHAPASSDAPLPASAIRAHAAGIRAAMDRRAPERTLTLDTEKLKDYAD